MTRARVRPLPVVAGLLMVTGFALMIASLRVGGASSAGASTASAAVVPTVATAAAAVGTPEASDPAALRLFARAQAAARTLAYGGVTVVSRWERGVTSSVVVDVDHQPGEGTFVAAGGGAADDASQTPTFALESGPADEAAMLAALVRNYRLVSAGGAVVVGRPAQVVEVDRADGTVAARYWIDRGTGLVLRRVLLDEQGDQVESTGFVQVTFDPAPEPSASASAMAAQAWSVVPASGVAALRASGWPVPEDLSGGLDLYQVREQQSASGPCVQLSYTDGLVAMSVFLQRGALDTSSLSGYRALTFDGGQVWSRAGSLFFAWQTTGPAATSAPADATTASRDIVVSATTDSPSAPIGSVLAALPAQPAPGDGVGDRVSRGVKRVTSWFDHAG